MAKPSNDKWFVILNPAAGGGKAGKQWESIKSCLTENGFDFDFAMTQDRGDAIKLATQAVLDGYRRIIGIGGDGTNNEVVNGIFSQEEISPGGVWYTLIPIGTGNDWIKTYGIPKDWSSWIPQIKKMKTKTQDLGLVHFSHEGKKKKRYFVNVAGLAYDAFIGKKAAERKGGLKSKAVYLSLVVSQLFKYRNRKAAVIFEDQEIEAEFYSINLGICKYSGGGMQLVPHAIPDDGLLALTYDTGFSKAEVIMVTPKLFSGKIGDHKKVFTHQVKRARVEAREEEPTFLEVDGEFIGETPCEFFILEKVLNVIVPTKDT